MAKQVIPTICQTGCILKLDREKLYSASEAAATVFDLKQFPIANERLRKKLYYFSTSRPVNKDELPSNQDNAFRDTHGKPVLVLNAKKQLCVALLPDEIYPRWLGSTWQRYVTKKEREEYEQTCLAFSQGLLAVLVSLFLQVFTGVLHLIQATRQKSLTHAREESRETRPLGTSKKSHTFFYGWKEKVALPLVFVLLVSGALFYAWIPEPIPAQDLINQKLAAYKAKAIPKVRDFKYCQPPPREIVFVSMTQFEGHDTGVRVPQNLDAMPP